MIERVFPQEIEKYHHEVTVATQTVRTVGRVILEQVNNRQAERNGLEFKAEVDMLADKAGIDEGFAFVASNGLIHRELLQAITE